MAWIFNSCLPLISYAEILMEAVILHLILQRPGACKPSCWWYCACTPALFAGLCLSGPCWTPKTSTNAAGSAAAVAKMMMGCHVEGRKHGLCSWLCHQVVISACGRTLTPRGNKATTRRSKSNFRHTDREVLYYNAHRDKALFKLCRYQIEILQLAFSSLSLFQDQIADSSVAKHIQKCRIPALCYALGCDFKIQFHNFYCRLLSLFSKLIFKVGPHQFWSQS